MKWSIGKNIKRDPRYGEIKEVRKFALFPKRMGSCTYKISMLEYKIWLEYYYEQREYQEHGKWLYRPGSMAQSYRAAWVTLKRFQKK